MAQSVLLAYVLFNIFLLCDSGRILVVVPTPSISHQVVFRPLVKELIKRGHEVVYSTTDPIYPKGQTPQNLIELDFHDMSYGHWSEAVLSKQPENNAIDYLIYLFNVIDDVFEKQIKSVEFQSIVNDGRKFDLIISEALLRPPLVLKHVIKAPMIQMSSLGATVENYESIGVPTHPILYPEPMRQRLYNLTMWEKLSVFYMHYYTVTSLKKRVERQNEMVRRVFGPDVPDLRELEKEVNVMLFNAHPIFEGNYPVPPGVVYIWGIHKKPQNELPKDLKTYLDSSKHGVIYMSFGTNVDPRVLPPEKIQMFAKVFSKLPYDILWKWNGDELPGKPDNVRIGKWFPQSDLLRHPKIKLFITQGGIQSTDEAIQAKVPLIGVPMLGDQWYNSEKYVHLGIGAKLDFQTITEDNIKEAIDTVISNKSYKQNIAKLDTLIRDEPMSGLDRAVWWTEYVLRHGGAQHLRSPAANISWFEYLELELVLTVLIVCLTLLAVALFVVYKIYSFANNNFLKIKIKSH